MSLSNAFGFQPTCLSFTCFARVSSDWHGLDDGKHADSSNTPWFGVLALNSKEYQFCVFCISAVVHCLSILLDDFTDLVFVCRNGTAPQIPPADTGTPSMSTFFSDSPDSPMDLDMSSTIRDCGRDLGGFSNQREERGPAAARQAPSACAPDDEIAPWMSTGPSTFNGVAHNGSFFDDRPTHTRNPATTRPDTRASDSFDPMFHSDDRRPSMASLTTVGSQNSAPISRTNTNRGTQHRRLGAFFGDDGRDSSMGSDTSILTPGRDHSTSSQSRKARHNSVQTNNTDGGRTGSPSSSRPRSPQPSSDVTPWLFQDFKVSARDIVCPCITHVMHVCPTMLSSASFGLPIGR